MVQRERVRPRYESVHVAQHEIEGDTVEIEPGGKDRKETWCRVRDGSTAAQSL